MFPDMTPTAQLNRPVSDEDRRALLSLFNKSNKRSALTWLLCPEPEYARFHVSTVTETVRCQSLTSDVTAVQLAALMQCISVTQQQIQTVEEHTQLQRNSPLWLEHRAGQLTASMFGVVVKCAAGKRKPSASLFNKSLLGEYDASGAKAVQWGQVHEQTAVVQYATVQPSGLWLHEKGFLGASPDGIIDCAKIIHTNNGPVSKPTGWYNVSEVTHNYLLRSLHFLNSFVSRGNL